MYHLVTRIGKAVPHPLTMGKTALGLEQEPFAVFRFFYRPIGMSSTTAQELS